MNRRKTLGVPFTFAPRAPLGGNAPKLGDSVSPDTPLDDRLSFAAAIPLVIVDSLGSAGQTGSGGSVISTPVFDFGGLGDGGDGGGGSDGGGAGDGAGDGSGDGGGDGSGDGSGDGGGDGSGDGAGDAGDS